MKFIELKFFLERSEIYFFSLFFKKFSVGKNQIFFNFVGTPSFVFMRKYLGIENFSLEKIIFEFFKPGFELFCRNTVNTRRK